MARHGNTEIQYLADRYCRSIWARTYGVPGIVSTEHYVSVSGERGAEIAAAYDRLPVYDTALIDGSYPWESRRERLKPLVERAYMALEVEIYFQFHDIIRTGYSLIPWTEPGQPYADSAAMMSDVREHRRLYFFTGGESHPYFTTPHRVRHLDSRLPNLTGNDMLRAVHDIFGHAACGFGFGARGEENAWIHHSMMFSPIAQLALTTETRGQNSWVNFGPYASLPVTERPYATQKTAILPAWVTDWQSALQFA
jgi:hypothetical protein